MQNLVLDLDTLVVESFAPSDDVQSFIVVGADSEELACLPADTACC